MNATYIFIHEVPGAPPHTSRHLDMAAWRMLSVLPLLNSGGTTQLQPGVDLPSTDILVVFAVFAVFGVLLVLSF